MLWFLLAAAAIGTRVLIPFVRREATGGPASLLVREFGVRGTGPDGKRTRAQHVLAAVFAALTTAACVGLGVGSGELADQYPLSSTMNQVMTGVSFLALMLACIAVLATLISLAKAPFAPKRFDPSIGNG